MDTIKLWRDDADVTGLDISQWVDVQAGIDPGDEAVRVPVYGGSDVGYGRHLAYVGTRERTFTIPLLLDAASTDELAALQASIEGVIGGRRPHLSWQREGASSATWWRVRYGAVLGSSRYDQKMEAQTIHARRVLTLVLEPFGTGSRVVSPPPVWTGPTGPGWALSSAAAGPRFAWSPSNPAVGQLPSIGGDAEVRWRIAVQATSASGAAVPFGATGFYPGRYAAGFTATPYTPMGANAGASLMHQNGTFLGATVLALDPWSPAVNALGSGVALQFNGTRLGSGLSIYFPGQSLAMRWQPTAPPPGLYRLFAAVRAQQHTTAGSTLPARMQIQSQGVRGPIATLALRSPSQWVWYDVGDVVSLDDVQLNFAFPTGWTAAGSPLFMLAGFTAIPKQMRYWEVDGDQGLGLGQQWGLTSDSDDGLPVAGMVFSNLQNMHSAEYAAATSGLLYNRGQLRGELPITQPVASGQPQPWLVALALRETQSAFFLATATHHSRENVGVHLVAWDRYTFAK